MRLDQIAFDAGTQIRAAIDPQVVSDYAEAMTNGATFPPIVVFHDGNQHYLADGFHRFMAAQRLLFKDIAAEVRAGTKEDALWFALGANKTNGKRLTDGDKQSAIILAVRTWPSLTQKQIAEQIGCSQGMVSHVINANNLERPARVTGADGKTYPSNKSAIDSPNPKRAAVKELIAAGESSSAIRKELQVSRELIADVRRESSASTMPDRSASAQVKRREQIRTMAEEGYSSHQVAAKLELSEEGCRKIARAIGVVFTADKALGRSHRHDSERIVERMVMDAENLTADVNLIDFSSLDHTQIAGWLGSLAASRDKLGSFIRRLMKEQQKHGEAA